MDGVDIDAAHVRAVAAKLGAPMTVWLFKMDTRHGEGVDVYATQELARAALDRYARERIDDYKNDPERVEDLLKALADDPDTWTDENDHYYSVEPVQVIYE